MDISRAFTTESKPVSNFFREIGAAYYIPFYQRKYSWDTDNVHQLMEDIKSGVNELITSKDHIHFMGTIILVTETDINNNIYPLDQKALPTRIDNVIDGQQRLSTITLLACSLYQRISELKTKIKIPEDDKLGPLLEEVITGYLTKLQDIFSVDLGRGKPKRKPIIIRSNEDRWTFDGEDEKNYCSDISIYLAKFIRAITENEVKIISFPKISEKTNVQQNLKEINNILDENIDNNDDNDDFPSALSILKNINQSDLWDYPKPEIENFINTSDTNLISLQQQVSSLIKLFAFSYYLLEHCCFTVIRPISQVRAFDMFQSLNATGTPLTAIETFKPVVVNSVESEKKDFKQSNFYIYFETIENLMRKLNSASGKNKRTNEYLTLFATAYEGKQLTKQFSLQRLWLLRNYEKCKDLHKQEEFIHQMADVATYCKKIIFSKKKDDLLDDFTGVNESEKKLALLCLIYLKDAGHKMAHTILCRFYSLAIRENKGTAEAKQEFFTACQIVAAFFTLWRSALPNNGLDNVYRTFLQDFPWYDNELITLEYLKKHFQKSLNDRKILEKSDWQKLSVKYLRFDNNIKKVCRFALFIASHDTCPDKDNPGLMKKARGHTQSYLEPEKWCDDNLEIEHIAPQTSEKERNDTSWDSTLYDEKKSFHSIGNLTLLQKSINASVSNKNWREKWVYYKSLSEIEEEKLQSIEEFAQKYNVELSNSNKETIQQAKYNPLTLSLVTFQPDSIWNADIVLKRTERICKILGNYLYKWLE